MKAYLTPDAPPANEFICRRLRIPASVDFLSLVTGAIASLMFESSYEKHGELTPEETAQLFKQMYLEIETEYGCMVGEIRSFVRETLPVGILPCDGTSYLRSDYPDLYSVLPAAFIIDADTFFTPDLRRRGLIGTGESISLGELNTGDTGGAEEISITEAQLTAHTHETQLHSHTDLGHSHFYNAPGVSLPVVAPGEVPATAPNLIPASTVTGYANLTDASVIVDPAGGGEPVNILNPYMAVLWGIVAR